MISVVIPTFNEENAITQCLQSLTHQDIPREEYEIIVVDGNSLDKTRDLANELADRIIIQTSQKIGGARNDGIVAALGNIVATTDADCICPPNWLSTIMRTFAYNDIVQLYGPVYPIENKIRYKLSLDFINALASIGYYTGILYYTLGCNTAFDRETFINAGMYRCIDAGDDLEIAMRMKQYGRIMRNRDMRIGFSMRRYRQFGTLKSLYEWAYIVAHGGKSDKYLYSRRVYK